MKNYIIYLILIVFFVSCTDNKEETKMDEKKEMVNEVTKEMVKKEVMKTETSHKVEVPKISEVPKAVISKTSPTIKKKGSLTTKWCAENGMLADCRMESIVCGYGGCFKNWDFEQKEIMQLVVYVHDDLKYYNIEPSKTLHLSEMLEIGINRNLVSVSGQFDSENNIIVASKFSAPPPPKKSFFKGCL